MRTLLRRLGDRLFDYRIARLRHRARSRRGALGLGARLIALGRFEEADAVLATALARWPARPRLLELRAASAHAAGRFAIARDRWEALRRVEPSSAQAWGGIAANARMLDDLKAAEATIREALDHFPQDLGIASEAARVFGQIGRFDEAASQWRRLLDLDPIHQDWYQGYALSLVVVGRFDEAQAILDEADAHYPEDRDLLGMRAMLAMERRDWNDALALWRRYSERFPEEKAGWEGRGETLAAIHAARIDGPDEATDAIMVEVDTIEDAPIRSLLLEFESIGADCEFGLVQRRFAAEPLGLLRFNDAKLPNLLSALAADFEGMGDPDNTSIEISRSGEFYIGDRRWNLGLHTMLFAVRHEASTVYPKMCRRIAYLRDKFLDDLRAAEKVFVFKSNAIDLDGLRKLHAALRAYGPVRLLHVRRAGVPLADRPFDVTPGQVYRLDEDLFVGFLGRLGNDGSDWGHRLRRMDLDLPRACAVPYHR